MIPILARQSIILKSGRDDNTILGNYECAYAIGLLSKLAGIPLLEEGETMTDIYQDFVAKLGEYQPTEEREARVKKILLAYDPTPLLDEQMKELIQMGCEEERVWQM